MLLRKKIAIFCGGPSSEHEVSLKSASTIFKFIDKNKYKAYYFYISKKNKAKLILAEKDTDFNKINPNSTLIEALRDLKKKEIFAFLAGIHGEFVEDGRLQVLLEYLSIPYSGSGSFSSALCMDKYRSMLIVKNLEGVTIPKTVLVNKYTKEISGLEFPVFVKPNKLGSSVGIYKAENEKELSHAIASITGKLGEDEILIQEFIGGIEFSCGVLEDKDGKAKLLPPIEIHPMKAKTFDYASKYELGGSDEITPPKLISKAKSEELSEITHRIHNLLGCNVYSRSDFKILDGKIFYLETNTLPGMTATSLLPKEADAAGIPFKKLLEFIIENSLNG